MQDPWFNDVIWSEVLNKSQKPPCQPDINCCYFENNDLEDEDNDDSPNITTFYSPTLQGNGSKRDLMRKSYYVHSTV